MFLEVNMKKVSDDWFIWTLKCSNHTSRVFRGSEEPRTAYGCLFSKLNSINKGTRESASGDEILSKV